MYLFFYTSARNDQRKATESEDIQIDGDDDDAEDVITITKSAERTRAIYTTRRLL